MVAALLWAMPLGAATHIWTGASSDRLSDAANWTNGSPAGDPAADVELPPFAARKTIVNDVDDVVLRRIAFSGGDYSLGGKRIHLLDRITSVWRGNGGNVLAAGLLVDSDVTIDGDSGSDLTLSGAISGAGGLTKLSQGRLTFAGASPNRYAGTTRVLGGRLLVAKSAGATAIPGALALGPSSTLDLGGHTAMIGATTMAASAAIVNGPIVLAGDVVITAAGDDFVVTLADVVLTATRTITVASPTGGVWLNGVSGPPAAGLVINGGAYNVVDGTYSGPTTLNAATATIRNAATAVTVNRGSRLSGSTGPVISHGGTIADLDVTGALQLDRASTIESLPNPGVVRVTGSIDLGGASPAISSGLFAPGTQTTLIENISSAPVRGTLAALGEGAITADRRHRISYHGGAGGDVVLTDVSRVPLEMRAYTNGEAVPLGQAVKVTASLSIVYGATPLTHLPAANGEIIVRDRAGDVIGRSPAGFGNTTIPATPLRPGRRNATVEYSGDDFYAPVSTKVELFATGPQPLLDSVTPETLTAGVPTELVFRGSNFIAPVTVTDFETNYRATLVSPTEVRAVVIPKEGNSAFAVANDGIDRPYALEVLKIVPPPPSSIAVAFDAASVTAKTAPNVTTYWINSAAAENVIDTNAGGIARWELGSAPPEHSTWAVADAAGEVSVTAPSALPSSARRSAAGLLQLGTDGKLSRLEVEGIAHILWVRPGVGAWRLDSTSKSPHVHVRYTEVYEVFVSAARPMRSSPSPPSSFAAGDVVVAVFDTGSYSLLRVPAQLPELQPEIVAPFPYDVYEGTPVVVNVWRVRNSTTTESVQYQVNSGTADIVPAHGTLTFRPGEFRKSFVIETRDDHARSFGTAEVDLDWNGVSIVEPLYIGNLVFARDAPSSPDFVVMIDDVRVAEGDSGTRQATLNVVLSEPDNTGFDLNWRRDDAKASGRVTFLPRQTRGKIVIPFDANTTAEPDRNLGVTLLNVSPAGKTHGVVAIIDDDGPRLTIDDVAAAAGAGAATFTVSLTRTAAQPVSVAWHSDGGTRSGTLTFAPGETAKTIDAGVPNVVVLSDANVPFAKAAGIAKAEDPAGPALALADAAGVEGTTVYVPLRLTAAAAVPVAVRYATYDGTATSPHDYVAASGSVTFAPGEVEKTMAIATVRNDAAEPERTFFVVLGEATAAIARGTAICTIRDVPPRRRAAGH